jgi:hypothetical protein
VEENLIVAPTANPRIFRTEAGGAVTVPDGWTCLPPGDAGLTRRVKLAGPTWTVIEKRGRKKFSRGVWASAAIIESARAKLQQERAEPAYERRRAADSRRREKEQESYAGSFRQEILEFLNFSPGYSSLAERLAEAITRHATPVGSGTVARTKRISVARRAEAAVIAWLRHQTTVYDQMKIARVRGERRRVRRQLASVSRALLDVHRREGAHPAEECVLCRWSA